MTARTTRQAGFTLLEAVVTMAITALLIVAFTATVQTTLDTHAHSQDRNDLAREARFAMQRMTAAVRATRLLLVPLAEDPGSYEIESIRDPGVLAVTLDPTLDRDLDGIADADNDGDGRIDEDLGRDASNDGRAGLIGIDDDNNGFTDLSLAGVGDDDETATFGGADEDPINGVDDDGDGSIDEDNAADMNGDGAPGRASFDDDGDGFTDEGTAADDDEDGAEDEDWLDAVVFVLSGSNLIERHPVVAPADGTDYVEQTIAQNVASFRVERLPRGANRRDLVELTLTLSRGSAQVVVQERVRVGGPP